MNISLRDLAQTLQGVVHGDETVMVSTLSPIENILAGSLVFADKEENLRRAENSEAACILVNQKLTSAVKPIIQVAHPFKAFIHLLSLFYPGKKPSAAIHPSASIASDVKIGKNVFVGPYVIIESGSIIGDNCVIKSHVHIGHEVLIGADTTIHPHVTVYDYTHIGKHVIIHAGSIIGSDGFGYTFVDNHHLKVPHVGHVLIEDHVEIGANTVIDRATLGATVVGEGTKIDNLVQIAHSVKLGKHNILCAFTGVAGSTTTGDRVIFAANVGVSDHVTIEDDVILTARAGVPPRKHLLKGNVYLGNPARPKEKGIEQEVGISRLPIMRKKLHALTDKLKELEKRLTQVEEK